MIAVFFFLPKIPVLMNNSNNKNHFMYFMDILLDISSGFTGVFLIFIAFVKNTPNGVTVWDYYSKMTRQFFFFSNQKIIPTRTVWRQRCVYVRQRHGRFFAVTPSIIILNRFHYTSPPLICVLTFSFIIEKIRKHKISRLHTCTNAISRYSCNQITKEFKFELNKGHQRPITGHVYHDQIFIFYNHTANGKKIEVERTVS